MARYLVTVEYLGTAFHGFQKQPGVPTVQGSIEEALGTYAGEEVQVAGAGRTDTGVHAVGQAAAFDLPAEVDEPRAVRSLNGLLARGVAVTSMRRVPDGFDPRRDAEWREYRYFILNRPAPSPLLERTTHHFPGDLDRVAMESACALFLGGHDFAAFKIGDVDGSTVRTITRCQVTYPWQGLICMIVRANAFLYRMVRVMAGAVLSVGRGQMEITELEGFLAGREGPCADPLPAQGLFLWQVSYPNGSIGG